MSVFGSYIVWYLFLAGLGSGCFFVAASCGFYDAAKKSPASQKLLERVQCGFYIAPCCAIFAALLLFLDLGAPDRAWLLLISPFQSIVSIGAWLLILFIIVSGVLAIWGLAQKDVPRMVVVTCWALGVIFAFGVMLYTGLLLSDMVSIDFWYSCLLPLVFIVSSLSTGLAALLGVGVFIDPKLKEAAPNDAALSDVRARNVRASISGPLDKLALIFSIAELLVLAAFLFDRFWFSEAARYSCEQILFGDYAILFWLGVCLCGFAIPWFIQIFNRVAKISPLKIVSSVGVLVAGLCLRYCIVGAAAYTTVALVFS